MRDIDQDKIYVDRKDAGVELGKMLEEKYKNKNALVLGIPRGGIVIAYEIAKILNGELSVVITKKLPHPLHEELAIGATAENGSVYLTSFAKTINNSTIKDILAAQQKEILSRIHRFRKGKSLPDMDGRVIILADDGIATGSTLVPAIKMCKSKKASKIIVAAPVSGANYVSDIDELADEVVIAERPEMFYAVEQVYEDFRPVPDEEVIKLLDDFEEHKKLNR
jgi:putative phosphoribosyl transferase